MRTVGKSVAALASPEIEVMIASLLKQWTECKVYDRPECAAVQIFGRHLSALI
jgi:hypothetical protein